MATMVQEGRMAAGAWGWDRSSGDKKCGGTAVPEGGTSLMYMSLAGLCCFGAMVYRLRRQRARERI